MATFSQAQHQRDSAGPVGFAAVLREEEKRLGKPPHEAAALCISGGGIPSATFALGVLQGLTEKGILSCFDYLSTVSGGGYIGSWLSAWIKRTSHATVMSTLALSTHPEPDEISHLRRFSNYLTPKLGLLSGDSQSSSAICC
jgi:predicted acylesterase/phospholipase RssA